MSRFSLRTAVFLRHIRRLQILRGDMTLHGIEAASGVFLGSCGTAAEWNFEGCAHLLLGVTDREAWLIGMAWSRVN